MTTFTLFTWEHKPGCTLNNAMSRHYVVWTYQGNQYSDGEMKLVNKVNKTPHFKDINPGQQADQLVLEYNFWFVPSSLCQEQTSFTRKTRAWMWWGWTWPVWLALTFQEEQRGLYNISGSCTVCLSVYSWGDRCQRLSALQKLMLHEVFSLQMSHLPFHKK